MPTTGWHSQGYLPHLDVPGLLQFITFRLGDSVPEAVLKEILAATKPGDAERLRRIETCEGHPLDRVLQAWKLFTAKEANRLLDRHGTFWDRDYFDRYTDSLGWSRLV